MRMLGNSRADHVVLCLKESVIYELNIIYKGRYYSRWCLVSSVDDGPREGCEGCNAFAGPGFKKCRNKQ